MIEEEDGQAQHAVGKLLQLRTATQCWLESQTFRCWCDVFFTVSEDDDTFTCSLRVQRGKKGLKKSTSLLFLPPGVNKLEVMNIFFRLKMLNYQLCEVIIG